MDNSVVVKKNLLHKWGRFRRNHNECLGNNHIEIFCSTNIKCSSRSIFLSSETGEISPLWDTILSVIFWLDKVLLTSSRRKLESRDAIKKKDFVILVGFFYLTQIDKIDTFWMYLDTSEKKEEGIFLFCVCDIHASPSEAGR